MFFVSLFLDFEGRFIISREVCLNGEKTTFYEKWHATGIASSYSYSKEFFEWLM